MSQHQRKQLEKGLDMLSISRITANIAMLHALPDHITSHLLHFSVAMETYFLGSGIQKKHQIWI